MLFFRGAQVMQTGEAYQPCPISHLGQGAKGFAHHGAGGGTGREEHLRDSLLLLRGVCEAHMGGGGRCVCEANMGGWKQKCDDGAGKHTPQDTHDVFDMLRVYLIDIFLGSELKRSRRSARVAFPKDAVQGHMGGTEAKM